MVASTYLPLLALLVLPTFGRPAGRRDVVSVAASASAIPDGTAITLNSTCYRDPSRIRYVKHHSYNDFSSASSALSSPSSTEISSSAVTSPAITTSQPAATPRPSSVSTSAARAATSASSGAPAGDATTLLDLHNTFRAKFGANALTWSSELADYASTYAGKCVFAHSKGPYGENLAAGVGGGYDATSAFNSWADEAISYDWNQPGFSLGTGHFTQLVWKGTAEVGCGVVQCDDGTIFSNMGGQNSTYVICEYRQPGNIVGDNGQYFRDNVGTRQSN